MLALDGAFYSLPSSMACTRNEEVLFNPGYTHMREKSARTNGFLTNLILRTRIFCCGVSKSHLVENLFHVLPTALSKLKRERGAITFSGPL